MQAESEDDVLKTLRAAEARAATRSNGNAAAKVSGEREFPTVPHGISKRNSASGRPLETSIQTRCAADIQPTRIDWLWPGRVARSKLTVIAGHPGLGKSQIGANIAATVSRGGTWPVSGDQCTPSAVLMLSAEDDPSDTLRPRLEAAGADLSRVHIVESVIRGFRTDGTLAHKLFSFAEDLHALEIKLAQLGDVALLIVDPISAYLGKVDSHKNAEVRALLAPLSDLAGRRNLAVLGVSHLNKAGGSQAITRVTGSLAFVAAARAAFLVAPDPNNRMRRFFLPIKTNFAQDPEGLAFVIQGMTIDSPAGFLATSRVAWEPEPVTVTADQVLQELEKPRRNSKALDEAKDWLAGTLSEGPLTFNEILEAAKSEGISEASLRRAKKALGVKSRKPDMADVWYWYLPDGTLESAPEPQEEEEISG